MSTPDSQEEGRQITPFANVLQQIQKGQPAQRAATLLNDLVQAVTETGEAGTLTIVVKVAPYKKNTTDNLDVTVKVTAKLPEPEEATSAGVFFHDGKGNLRRDDPNQLTLPVRDVSYTERNSA